MAFPFHVAEEATLFFFFKLNDNLYRFKVFYTYDIAMN